MTAASGKAAICAAVLLGLLLAPVLTGGGGRAYQDPKTRYTDFVRTYFIERQKLVVRNDVDENAGVPIVDLAPDVASGKDAPALQFALSSPLMQDIRRNDPTLWTIENGRVVDIDADHGTSAPFKDQKHWRGRLLFRRPPSRARPEGLVLSPLGWTGPSLHLTESIGSIQTGDPRVRRLDLVSAPQGDLSAPAFDVYCRPDDPIPAVRVRRIGDEVGLWADGAKDCQALAGGPPLKPHEFAALALGDEITLQHGRATFRYRRIRERTSEGALSAMTPSGERARDPMVAWWSAAVERDYIAALPKGSVAALQGDISSSLDPDLQYGAQHLLDAFVAQNGKAAPEPRIGAITIMDANTGEVLAMASSPRAPADARELVDQDDTAAKAARANQNLEILPIGSVAKPVIAAAILSDRPDLISLTIPAQAETTDLLGMPFSLLTNSHAPPGPMVDFDSFIQNSDNIYAATLLLLGSSDRGADRCRMEPGEHYGLNGAMVTGSRPKSAFEVVRPDGFCAPAPPAGLRQLRWADRLNRLFDVNIDARNGSGSTYLFPNCAGGGGRFGSPNYDASPWASLFEERPALNPCKFRSSTVRREALAIDAARSFRSDLLMVILGNGESRWSAVKVAEAYARLVTGHRVSASFIAGGARRFPSLEGFPLRARLTHALTLVPSGTAAATYLPTALAHAQTKLRAQGLVLGAFAKTGTPETPKVDYRPVDKAINLLIARNVVVYDSATGQARLQVGPNSALLPAQASAAVMSRATSLLAANDLSREAMARFGVRPGAVVQTLRAYNAQAANGQKPYVVKDNTLLVRVGARRDAGSGKSDKEVPYGKVLALVVGAYDPKAASALGQAPFRLDSNGRAYDGANPPIRAYSIVVTLQFEIPGRSNGAADLAGEVVDQLLADRLTAARGRLANAS